MQQFDFGVENVYSVFFLNEQNGWLGLSGAKIAHTSNGGLNWIIQQPNNMISNNITDIFMVNDTGLAGTGWFQRIFKTVNGGVNWGYQIDSAGSVRISVLNSMLAWSGYLGTGFVSHTFNGGGPIFYVGFT